MSRPYKIKGAYGNLDRLTHCGANRRHGPFQHRRCVEYPRPYAFGCYRLPSPSAGKPSNDRQGESIARETSLVCEPVGARVQDVPVADHSLVLFMQATRWADDIRTMDKAQNKPPWHYINLPFKPDGQPPSVQAREPEAVNILTAMAENERIVRDGTDPERKAIALAWLFHLAGDIRQPVHAVQLFKAEYPNGDRGGNQICVRVTQAGQPMNLHRFWDGVIISGSNLTGLRNEATAFRSRQEFQRSQLTELANTDFGAWAKELTTLSLILALAKRYKLIKDKPAEEA